jgi:methylated-DNA-[protein]-cysteine S-methyltransferase
MSTLYRDSFDTPMGGMVVLVDDQGRLHALGFVDDDPNLARSLGTPHDVVERSDPSGLTTRLLRYFAGELTVLDDIDVAMHGTPFQCEVWAALRQIPVGETWSYAQLAAHIGRPTATRAVGSANGANPIGVVVPCHRVIGADGSLTGYAGGIARKRWLLAHENALAQPSFL